MPPPIAAPMPPAISECTIFLPFLVFFRTRKVPRGQGLYSAVDAVVETRGVAVAVVGIRGINKVNMVTNKNVEMVFFIKSSLTRPMERNDLTSILA
jgi:hypothetical protein